MENYKALLELEPTDIEAIVGYVKTQLEQKSFDEAERFLLGKIAELKDIPQLYVALGIVYRDAGKDELAKEAFEQAVTLNPQNAQAYFYLANQQDRLGNRQDARKSLEKVIEIEPYHADALNYLGYLDAEEGVNLEQAKAMIERAINIDPQNGAFIDSLGWVYFQRGDYEQAVIHLEKAAELLGEDPTILEHLGDAYFKQGDLEQARRTWIRAKTSGADAAVIENKIRALQEQLEQTQVTMP